LPKRKLFWRKSDCRCRDSATPEGFTVKPVRAAADLNRISETNPRPGLAPHLHGACATLYPRNTPYPDK
jgi:hypothetical protein